MKRRSNMTEGQRRRYNKRIKKQNRKELRRAVIVIAVVFVAILGFKAAMAYYSDMHFDAELFEQKTATVEWDYVNARQDAFLGLTSVVKAEIPEGTVVELTGRWSDELLEEGPLHGRTIEIFFEGEEYTVPEEALDLD